MKTLSVLLTTYNNVEITSLALRSLVSQDCLHPWELIVCDDGSSSAILNSVRSICSSSRTPVRVVWQPDIGCRLSESRNNGLRLATGDIIVCLDGDVVLPPNFLQRHALAHTGPRMLVGGVRQWRFLKGGLPDPEQISRLMEDPELRAKVHPEIRFQQRLMKFPQYRWMACTGCNLSFDASCGARFDEQFVGWGPEDIEFTYRLQHIHGYETILDQSAWCLHLERGWEKDAFPMRPQSPAMISAYVRNMLYFRDKYPNADLRPAMEGLSYYARSDQGWEFHSTPIGGFEHIHQVLEAARIDPEPALAAECSL